MTQQLVAVGCDVVGVDSSPELLEAAVRLGLDARSMDGHELTFAHEFDAVFSHAALHWMIRDPSAVLRVRMRQSLPESCVPYAAQLCCPCVAVLHLQHATDVACGGPGREARAAAGRQVRCRLRRPGQRAVGARRAVGCAGAGRHRRQGGEPLVLAPVCAPSTCAYYGCILDVSTIHNTTNFALW